MIGEVGRTRTPLFRCAGYKDCPITVKCRFWWEIVVKQWVENKVFIYPTIRAQKPSLANVKLAIDQVVVKFFRVCIANVARGLGKTEPVIKRKH